MNEATLRALIDASPTPMIVLDGALRVKSWNPAAERLFGWRADEVLDRPYPLVPEGEHERFGAFLAAVRRGEPVSNVLVRRQRRDGTLLDVNVAAAPVFDDAGALAWILVTVTDLTAQVRTEAALRRAEQELADLFENASIALHWVGPDGRILRVNRAELELLGYDREEYVGRHVADFHADRGAIDDLLARLAAGRTVHDYEARLRCKDGSVKDVLIDSSARWEDGRFVHTRCFTRDVTDRKRAEGALRQQAELVRAVLEGTDDAIFLKDVAGRYVLVNPAGARAIGRPAEEIIGRDDGALFPPDMAATIQAHDADIVTSGESRRFDLTLTRPDAQTATYLSTKSPYRDADGRILGVISVSRDITGREKDQAAASYLAAIVQGSDDAVVSKTLDGIITSWNPGAERVFGYTAAEAVGQRITIIIPPDRLAEELEVLARVRRGERVDHFETVRIRKDGVSVEISLTVSPVRNETGTIIGASKVARDIGPLKRLERERTELLARERAARADAEAANRAKDEFLATLSHELRTPLNAILGWAQVVTSRRDEQTLTQALQSIERNARLQVQLIEDLLDLSRIVAGKVRLETRPVDLGPVVLAATETIRPAAEARDIRLDTEVEAGTTVIMGDPDRLQQIFWNLLSNAVKFTPRGGRVRIVVEHADSRVLIRVSDTGQGIAADVLPHVFERFRQGDASMTRTHGGLGLGLAIVRHLVELQGGSVTATSPGAGQGSTFSVEFPLLPLRLRDAEARRQPSVPYQGPRCEGLEVLVVDDEADARQLLTVFLQDAGARVTQAESVRQALALLDGQRFDVVVSDLAMPDEDGFALAREVRARPSARGGQVPLVALTAHAGAQMRVRALVAGFNTYVSKPVEPAELAAVIGRLTHRETST